MNRRALLMLALVFYGAVVGIKLAAPGALLDRDQARQGLYVLDITQGGSPFLPYQPVEKPLLTGIV